jgi:beta-propeller repeat-containing protein/ASPM-SPD-2-Hydin domain-containing protein/HYDIN/CFA65/VesB family protein
MRPKTLALGFLAAVLGGVPSFAQSSDLQASPQSSASLDARVQANYGKLPLTFEANHGQTGSQVKFLSRGPGYTAFLTSDGVVLSLRAEPIGGSSATTAIPAAPSPRTTLQFKLVGAAANPAVVGEIPQIGRVNYFIGNNPAKWQRNVPTYAQVRYRNIYPGIDLLYYGNHRQLEYDFSIAPGVDPGQIQFEITGASQISLDSDGNLVLQTASGTLHFQSPAIYQESGGSRVPVSGAYVVNDPTHISFRVASYDASKPLVIDPVLVYSTYVGGTGDEQPSGIAVDSTGSVYIAGYTDSADFLLTTFGAPIPATNHVFVAKLDPTGSSLVYADYIGGNSQDYGIALALDSSNNVYLTGSTSSSNFPTVNPYQAAEPGSYSGFVTKVSADGSSLLYSTYLGGSGFDQPASIAVDSLNEAYVAGTTTSLNFPVANAYQSAALANQGGVFGNYGFITKFAADGSSLVYSTYLEGDTTVVQDCGTPCWPGAYTAVSAIALDANGSLYAAGTTNSSDFPATSGAYLTSNSPQPDSTIGFISKFASAGSLAYSTYFYGTSGNPVGIGAIAVDGSGSAYIAGTVSSDTTFPITSTGICDPSVYGSACSYAFVSKFDPTASTLLYSTFLGPNNYASPQSIALDSSDNAYVVANTNSAAFAINNAIEGYSNQEDMLLVELDPSGDTQLIATYVGGSGNDFANGVALDANGNIYVVGSTSSSDFPVTQGAFQSVLGGGADAFVVKIGPSSVPAVALSPGTLQYAPQAMGSTSAAQAILLRNMGSSALSISSITPSGDFAQTNTCGSSVAAASSCTLSITFAPTGVGTRSGAITLQDDAAGSPHVITLSGVGTGPLGALTPTSLSFSRQQVGTSGAAQIATLSNSGSAAFSISGIQATGDFAQTNNCPAQLTAGSSCAINVTFSPTASGTRTGTLTVNDSAVGSPQTANLTGSGLDFSLSSSPNSVSVKAGASASYNVTVAAVGGAFSNAIQLTCSGLPSLATCSFSPSSVTPGSSQASSTLTITTTAASAAALAPLRPAKNQLVYAVWMGLQGFGFFGIMLAGSKPRGKKVPALIALVLLVVGTLFLTACAGGTGIGQQSQPGTPSGTYTVTISGASGALQHSTPVNLIVR